MDFRLKLSKADAIALLRSEIESIIEYTDEESLTRKIRRTNHILTTIFNDADEIEKYIVKPRIGIVSSWDPVAAEKLRIKRLYEDINYYKNGMEEIVQMIDDFGIDPSNNEKNSEEKYQDITNVFIVHGQNHGVRDAIARFVERIIGNAPIILDEKPTSSFRPIYGKFKEYASLASCAICIFTADDEGRSLIREEKEYKNRARQNVIFETGYLSAYYGEERVIVLYEEGIELPSDIDFVEYISLNNWELKLAKALKKIYPDIDAERLLKE